MLAARMGRLVVAISLGLLLLAGCSDGGGDDDDDDGSGGGGKSGKPGMQVEYARKLVLSTVTGAYLQFGGQLEFRGRLLDKDGKAIKDGLISFALVGESRDSSLATIDVHGDNKGAFVNTLTAGEQPAAFRVRVSSDGAADVLVDVAVSGSGFGSLLVTAEYDGARLVAQRSVYARAGGKCDGSERREGDRFATLGEGDATVRLPALAADTEYAVTVIGDSPSGTTVAKGCIEGIVVVAEADVTVPVAFVDEPVQRAGTFSMSADLDTSGPASALAVAMSGAAEELVVDSEPGEQAPPDAEAKFLLDTLDATLHIAQAPPAWGDLAADLAADRMNNLPDEATPDHELQGMLEIEDKGPLLAIAEIARPAQDGLEHLRLTSVLSLIETGKTPASWLPQRIVALRSHDDADPVEIDLRSIDTTPSLRAQFMPDRDVLDVSRIAFDAQLGALATAVLRSVLEDEDDGGQRQHVRDVLGCELVSQWLDDQPYAGECDADCIQTFCDAAIQRFQTAAEGALSDLDVSRPSIALEGELEMFDRDGDLAVEMMRCDQLSGEWPAERKGARADSIAGTAIATATDGRP
jgi:hypothetical protein